MRRPLSFHLYILCIYALLNAMLHAMPATLSAEGEREREERTLLHESEREKIIHDHEPKYTDEIMIQISQKEAHHHHSSRAYLFLPTKGPNEEEEEEETNDCSLLYNEQASEREEKNLSFESKAGLRNTCTLYSV
jgi:hypothetical protein